MKADIVLRKINLWLKVPTVIAFCVLTIMVFVFGGEFITTLLNILTAVSAYEAVLEFVIQYLELRKKTRGTVVSSYGKSRCEVCHNGCYNYICCPAERIDIV